MKEPKLLQSFAINNEGEIVSVRDVERGKACNCACPECGEVLIARQGNVRAWHFAHESGSDCENSAESALHLAAKTIVADSSSILIPKLTIQGEYIFNSKVEKINNDLPQKVIDIQNAQLELPWKTKEGTIRPDVVISSGDETIFVEIAVTHFVDHDKTRKLKSLGISTIEINLDPTLFEEWTWEELKREVLDNSLNRHWVYHKDKKRLEKEVEKRMQKAILENVPTNSKKEHTEYRLTLNEVPVRVRDYSWGVTIWSGFDHVTNQMLKGVAQRYGGRWNHQYKTSTYGAGLAQPLIDHLLDLGAEKEEF